MPSWLEDDEVPGLEGLRSSTTLLHHKGGIGYEVLLSNLHHFGFNYRHIGIIVSQAVPLLSSKESSKEGGLNDGDLIALSDMIGILIIEGVARTLKNLVCLFSVSKSCFPETILFISHGQSSERRNQNQFPSPTQICVATSTSSCALISKVHSSLSTHSLADHSRFHVHLTLSSPSRIHVDCMDQALLRHRASLSSFNSPRTTSSSERHGRTSRILSLPCRSPLMTSPSQWLTLAGSVFSNDSLRSRFAFSLWITLFNCRKEKTTAYLRASSCQKG